LTLHLTLRLHPSRREQTSTPSAAGEQQNWQLRLHTPLQPATEPKKSRCYLYSPPPNRHPPKQADDCSERLVFKQNASGSNLQQFQNSLIGRGRHVSDSPHVSARFQGASFLTCEAK
jgi:hypothetical protein